MALTFTLHSALKAFSLVVTTILVSPAAFASTIPCAFTDAIVESSDLQLTLLSVAFSGFTVAFNCFVCPISRDMVFSSISTPVTWMVGSSGGFGGDGCGVVDFLETFTFTLVFTLPIVAVMVAVPTFFALTEPFFTVATFVLLDFHFTV